MKTRIPLQWLAPGAAIAAFAAVLAAFGFEICAFRGEVERWARRDLSSQVRLAAESLAEPLRTQDMRRIGEIARDLRDRDGLLLTIYSRPGGVFYRSPSAASAKTLRERADAGEYAIELGFDDWLVKSPLYSAFAGFALAALVGVAGMFAVFFALYRQRARIKELARLERFRREFVADVSHEVKTPLTGIVGAAEMMEDADGEGKVRLAAMVRKEAGRLNALVQQILDLSRLEREGAGLDLAEVDLTELVREVAEKYGVATGRTAGEDGSHDVVVADSRLVWEAVSNLVENAKRHSGTDDITVSLERGRDELIVVEDHGIGIPPAHAARVFERFYRVDPSRAAESGGAGLGLAIVRRIARAHGGEAECAPARPHGARFTISLPARPVRSESSTFRTRNCV